MRVMFVERDGQETELLAWERSYSVVRRSAEEIRITRFETLEEAIREFDRLLDSGTAAAGAA